MGLIGKLDFYFVLALVVILGTAGSLFLQFNYADIEFEALNASMYSIVHYRDTNSRESALIKIELDQLGNDLEELNLN